MPETFNVGDIVWEVRTSEHEMAVTACVVECEQNKDPARVRVKILTTGVRTITDGSNLYPNLNTALLALVLSPRNKQG